MLNANSRQQQYIETAIIKNMNYECDVGKLADTPQKMIEKLSE